MSFGSEVEWIEEQGVGGIEYLKESYPMYFVENYGNTSLVYMFTMCCLGNAER